MNDSSKPVDPNVSSASNLLQSIAQGSEVVKGEGGLYRPLATKGEKSLLFSLRYEPGVVKIAEKKGLQIIHLTFRFLTNAEVSPIPERDKVEELGGYRRLKKYAIPVAVAPINGMGLRDEITPEFLHKVFSWLNTRMLDHNWNPVLSFEELEQFAYAPFDNLPETPDALFKFPEW